jgi:hypothetical protein
MAIEGEVMTIHQKIQEAHNKNREDFGMGGERQMKVFDAPKIGDIEEIKQMLQYLLDKMHSMDLFMRNNMQSKYHREHQGQAERVKDPNEVAKALGLASVAQCNDMVKKELEKHGNDSKEVNSGAGKDTEQTPRSGSGFNRQGDFRAGNSRNTEMEQ